MNNTLTDIIDLEWEAFQSVHNLGGRASCQNDRITFFIMRKSQFLTWNEETRTRYLQDLLLAKEKGRNLLEEKYARMMEHTAPDEYARFMHSLPRVADETKKLIEDIVSIQLKWHKDYVQCYPRLAARARPVDQTGNTLETSFETYLRGELLTYSPETLQTYAAHIRHQNELGKNMSIETMENTAKMYGYASATEAEKETY